MDDNGHETGRDAPRRIAQELTTHSGKPEFYRAERAEDRFDVVVIGSGIGGLTTAALLSKAGRRVLVLERHYAMGGFTHTFRRRAYEWDVGVHYVGELQTEGTLPHLLMHDIAGDRLEWALMPAVYDRLHFPDRSYDVRAGREEFIAGLAADFPSERSAIARYVALADRAYVAAIRFFRHKALPRLLAGVTRWAMCGAFLKVARQTTLDALTSLTKDPRLVGVLTGQWGTYGLPPAESSFGIHAIVASHYLGGGAYPVGGAGSIAASVLPTIEAGGGKLLVNAEVEQILVRKGRVRGVRMVSGQEIVAPIVISDAGVANTFGRLLGEETRARFGLDRKLAEVEPSTGHVSLYVGLREPAHRIGLEATNLWIHPSYDHDRNVRSYLGNREAPLPTVYISFPSAKDPTWEARRGESATLEVVSFAPYEWFETWEQRRWRKRGAEYEELKARFSERLLQALYEHVPQTQGKVDYHELSTPLSTRHFGNYARGEIYGLSPTPRRFGLEWLVPRTPVRGLFLTGQDVVAHGVVGAMYGGLVTASAILRRDVLADVRRRSGT